MKKILLLIVATSLIIIQSYVSYSIKDTSPPVLNKSNIDNKKNDVSTNQEIILYFSENIKPGSKYGSIIYSELENNHLLYDTKITKNALVIKSDENLSSQTSYLITLPIGAIKDYSGNENKKVIKITFKTTGKSFNLSDDQIMEAIEIGKQGFQNALSYTNNNYLLSAVDSDYNMFIESAYILTPFHHILRMSAIKDAKYEEITFKEGKDALNTFKYFNSIYFEITFLGSEIDMHREKKVLLRQNGKIFKPSKIYGLDEFADLTDSWPDFPAYKKNVSVRFDNKDGKIDFSSSVELIIVHAPQMESIYEIDFSNYK